MNDRYAVDELSTPHDDDERSDDLALEVAADDDQALDAIADDLARQDALTQLHQEPDDDQPTYGGEQRASQVAAPGGQFLHHTRPRRP